MACLLTIETSTQNCSLALSVNGKSVWDKIHLMKNSHASLLGVFTLQAIEYARANNYKIEAVAISAGPGSYTGLRIGASEAKGLCYGFDIPLIAIPTLKIMALQAIQSSPFSYPIYCPMIDARRMEVFTALYNINLDEIHAAKADIINENSYKEYLKKYTIVFFGNGSDKCSEIIQSPNALFIKNIYPTAKAIIPLAKIAFEKKEFVDTVYFEPLYLKEFQATIAKKKIL